MKLSPLHVSYTFLLTFLGAVFCLQWWQKPSYPLWLWAVSGLLIILFITILLLTKKDICRYFLAGSIALVLAFFVVSRTTHEPVSRAIDFYATKEYVTIQGQITAEPDRRPLKTKYTIKVNQITLPSGETKEVTGLVLATDLRQFPRYQFGDQIEVSGLLEKPEQIETFHYDNFLSRYNIYSVIYRASFKLSDHQADGRLSFWESFKSILFKVKAAFESRVNRLLPEPQSSFMAGLLTGSRRGIPEPLMQNFNITGLTHIIAISGYNITIVIVVITGLLFWVPHRWRIVPAIAAIVAFTLFVGASAAVVRASIMGILGLLALQAGRRGNVRLSVLWTLFFMLSYNPKYLWYDAGFQLSFLAVLGLIEVGPMLEPFFKKVPEILGIREALQMTIAAQISAVPLIVFLFQRFSLIAPVANLLVAPFIPLAMLFGFTGTVLSYISFPLGQAISYLGWGCLQWIILVTRFCSSIPFASVNIPKTGAGLMFVYYAGLVTMVALWNKRKSN